MNKRWLAYMNEEWLAHRGLAFLRGAPPQSEDGVLLVYTGGCNALVAFWRDGKLVQWSSPEVIDPAEVEYWMRLPHPAFWPCADCPADLLPERELYRLCEGHR